MRCNWKSALGRGTCLSGVDQYLYPDLHLFGKYQLQKIHETLLYLIPDQQLKISST